MRISLSVVIPTWCEAAEITDTVRGARAIADEVIVVDAESPDGTAGLARSAGARVIEAPKGRGTQLDRGARIAAGNVLLFLHCDVRLLPEAREAIEEALADPDIQGGCFRVRYEPETFFAQLFSWANHVRTRWLRIYYGDSAVFVRRETYVTLGGFRSLPIFEDYDFVRRLERAARTTYVRHVIVRASARRFGAAPIRTLMIWILLQILYSMGVSAQTLALLYRDARPQLLKLAGRSRLHIR